MKTYILLIAKNFPKKHQCSGDETKFVQSILNGIEGTGIERKIHTMRQNYDLWEKRFEKINIGEAQLSLRRWAGKPYNSKQETILNLTKENGIGLEKLNWTELGWFVNDINADISVDEFAKNDGLSKGDWYNWLGNAIFTNMDPLAIIHFTPFRYGSSDPKNIDFFALNRFAERIKNTGNEKMV